MKLIVGLGNPGILYTNSRHNIGFTAVKAFAKRNRAVLKRDSSVSSFTAKSRIANQAVIMALPLTFMNLSGVAVKKLIAKYKIDLSNILVVCDDLDLDLGRLRIREKGSSGGHRGINSIINSLGTNNFARLRIGIGRPEGDIDSADYVLSSFRRHEKCRVGKIVEKSADCLDAWLTEGLTAAMNNYNKKEQVE
ncbi:MAG: aminoacyl-tRNA hydrolase [Candidatus Omnitrophica bacterium]|nr:aminoacyl-tRNA hydrolase [Candidatus Omnitrophota bacterium]